MIQLLESYALFKFNQPFHHAANSATFLGLKVLVLGFNEKSRV